MIPVMVTRFTLTLKKAITMDSNEDEDISPIQSFTAHLPSLYTDGNCSLPHITELESSRARVGLPFTCVDVGRRSAQDGV